MDRKAAARAYKELQHPMGVFRVLNTAGGKSFIGTSVNLPAMLNRQRAQLQLGGHPSTELQRDWNALGADAFTFEVLDELASPDDRTY
ncbi:MAG TPA: GIY-YIG nuclease family protein, partial [Rhodothermales bacterium]|nr:GIY-YIG nuclease family protein [Rhodothermales bacterium]